MIFGSLHSVTAQWLAQTSPAFKEAFDWIGALKDVPDGGVVQLQGDKMYVNIHGYDTLPESDCAWESHRHTLDLQYCFTGGEIIEYLSEVTLERQGEYNPAKDTEKWRGGIRPSARLHMGPSMFAIFLPGELHRPKVSDGINPSVYKLVVKIDEALLGNCGRD